MSNPKTRLLLNREGTTKTTVIHLDKISSYGPITNADGSYGFFFSYETGTLETKCTVWGITEEERDEHIATITNCLDNL